MLAHCGSQLKNFGSFTEAIRLKFYSILNLLTAVVRLSGPDEEKSYAWNSKNANRDVQGEMMSGTGQ